MDAPKDACVPRTYDLLRVRDCTRSISNAPVDITSNASELIRARARIRSSLCTPELVSARDYALEIVRDLASARIGLRKAGVVMVVPYLEASYGVVPRGGTAPGGDVPQGAVPRGGAMPRGAVPRGGAVHRGVVPRGGAVPRGVVPQGGAVPGGEAAPYLEVDLESGQSDAPPRGRGTGRERRLVRRAWRQRDRPAA